MFQILVEGGMSYMAPLTLIFIINLGLIVFVAFNYLQKKAIHPNWLESIRQLGGLALAFGAFGTLIGLFFAFGDLSRMQETLPFNVIMGGLKVALYTTLYGFIIFLISLTAHIILKAIRKDAVE